MTSKTHKDGNNNSKACRADDVDSFLRSHPDFFSERPELLLEIEVPHPAGGAVSLIERQVALLRHENKEFKNRIKELVDVARDNEQLISKLHHVSVALIETETVDDFVEVLSERVQNDFSANLVSVKVFNEDLVAAIQRREVVSKNDDELANFDKFLTNKKPICGRFNANQLNYLFSDHAEKVKSMALVPLVNMNTVGMIAIGSDDPNHFKAGMSTAFLSSLSDIASAVLKRHLIH